MPTEPAQGKHLRKSMFMICRLCRVLLLLLLLLLCYWYTAVPAAAAVRLLPAAVRRRERDRKFCCWFIKSDSSVLFLLIQTRIVFSVPLASTVAFTASICLHPR